MGPVHGGRPSPEDETTSPELRQVPLFADRIASVVRAGHKLRPGGDGWVGGQGRITL